MFLKGSMFSANVAEEVKEKNHRLFELRFAQGKKYETDVKIKEVEWVK